jgi:DDE superfamily endonuclease
LNSSSVAIANNSAQLAAITIDSKQGARWRLTYILHFDRQSKKTQRGAHRVLLCDRYDSHLTREILEFCEKRLIHIFALPPHTSHILQPLNVVLFQPFKHFHAKAIDYATRTGCSDFNKLEFLAAIDSIRQQTFKKNSILSSFRECSLIPYNPQIVLNKIQEYQSSSALVRPSTTPNALLKALTTPWTDRGLQNQAYALQAANPSRKKTLEKKFIKGALIQAKCAAQMKRQQAENTAAERERKARSSRPRRQLQKGRVLYASQARNMVKQREEEGGLN